MWRAFSMFHLHRVSCVLLKFPETSSALFEGFIIWETVSKHLAYLQPNPLSLSLSYETHSLFLIKIEKVNTYYLLIVLDLTYTFTLRTRERGEETGESYEVLTNELERISRDPPDTKRGQEGPPILRSLKQRMTPIKMCKVCYYTDGLESRRQKWERSVWGSKEGKEGRDSSVAAGTRQKRLILPHNSSKVKEVRDRLMIHNLAGWQAKY